LKDGSEIEGYHSEQMDNAIIGYGELVEIDDYLIERIKNMKQYRLREREWSIANGK